MKDGQQAPHPTPVFIPKAVIGFAQILLKAALSAVFEIALKQLGGGPDSQA